MNKALLVFLKNPVPGKVKTRLARRIGNEAVLKVYLQLLKYTGETTGNFSGHKRLYYSDFIPAKDVFFPNKEGMVLQDGENLGERMQKAFQETFREGYEKAVIIGTDCMQLKPGHIQSAFDSLDNCDVVIGPAKDGGYYLLGLKKTYLELFEGKSWSPPLVLKETIHSLTSLGLKHTLLPVLPDIDVYDDLIAQNIPFL
jgi:rSAM/selenodomain-associated transferase 1